MFENLNIKRIVIYLTAVMCISFGIGFAVLLATSWDSTGGFSSIFSGGRYEVNQEKTSHSSGLKKINIDATSADIVIIPEDRSDVKAQLTGRVSNREIEPKLEMILDNDRLAINAKLKNIIGININSDLQLKIYIPKNYEQSIQVSTASGDVEIRGFMLKEFICNVVSGDLKANDLTSEEISFTSASGSIEGSNITSKSTSFKIVSGNTKLQNFKGDLKGSSTSGKVRVTYATFDNNINLTSTSGDVLLSLPDNAEFYLDARTTSGDVSCSFPITISEKKKDNVLSGTVKSDKHKISIHVTSGDIEIE